jgi:XTP/dITP diphosphohydrolase
MRKLLLATNNKGKISEYQALLKGIPYRILTLSECGITTEVDESGSTYEENAALKATAFARESGLLTLADDSGLEVDALGGDPGIRSARYVGEGANDTIRNNFLLYKLTGVPEKQRTARFVCVIAIAAPECEVMFYEGERRGLITGETKGSHGHGYDPIFYVPEIGKTMAELTLKEKNQISHRARATAKARAFLINQ